jgi:hypothetical protein
VCQRPVHLRWADIEYHSFNQLADGCCVMAVAAFSCDVVAVGVLGGFLASTGSRGLLSPPSSPRPSQSMVNQLAAEPNRHGWSPSSR